MQISEHILFNQNDLKEKWQKARLAAIKNVAMSTDLVLDYSLDESSLLARIDESQRDLLLRQVFDNSRKLGLSLVKYLGMTWEVSDLIEILPHLELPCFAGSWYLHNDAYILQRAGCVSLQTAGRFGCDYWREALDGFVMGVGDAERLARHRSKGHGDDECFDILFSEIYTIAPMATQPLVSTTEQKSKKFGPIPIDLDASLAKIVAYFLSMKIHLKLEGYSEGILYYQLHAEEGATCGARGNVLESILKDEISKISENIKIQDVSPLAVYGGSS